MLLTLHGEANGPAVATVGTWDPFTARVANFAKRLCLRAKKLGWAGVPIILDPPPPAILNGEHNWPAFHDTSSRVQLLFDCGATAVGVIAFGQSDLGRGVADLLDAISVSVSIKEFWVRQGQSLGSGNLGNPQAIEAACAERAINLIKVRGINQMASLPVREALLIGSVARAARYVGSYPTLRRPASLATRLAWQTGTYQAVAIAHPRDPGQADRVIDVAMSPAAGGMAVVEWPSPSIEYLRFIRGPGDDGIA